jgi:hypothetical protein
MLVAEENKTFSVADVEALFPTMTPVETKDAEALSPTVTPVETNLPTGDGATTAWSSSMLTIIALIAVSFA